MSTNYENLELHLAALPLSRKHAQQIKACCGSYSACRSPYASKRFVLVPATERALIDDLVRTYCGYRNKITMIARGGVQGFDSRPAWVVVQDVNPKVDSATEEFARKFAKAYVDATARGLIR